MNSQGNPVPDQPSSFQPGQNSQGMMQQVLIGRCAWQKLKGAECKYPYKDTAVWAHPITGSTLNARQAIFKTAPATNSITN